MLSKEFINQLSNNLDRTILEVNPISGGDISSVYCIVTSSEKYVLKVNSNDTASKMFLAEKHGLEYISNTNTIKVPKVIISGNYNEKAFLVLEYIETKRPKNVDFELLGTQLAALHNVSSTKFGFEHDNFIGSLPQQNNYHKEWGDFYINERLIPQIKLAQSKTLLERADIPRTETMLHVCHQLFQNVAPSLLHGDLWNGNYLISTNGTPYLIDPAIYFGHHEVDIAMSKLFGGYGPSFYDAYHDIIPETEDSEQRIELYQLYYLLVHLNLFGSSYYNSVKQLLNKYFLL